MSRRASRADFHARAWVRPASAVCFALVAAGFAYSARTGAAAWQTFVHAGLCLLGAAAVVESWLLRISLLDDAVVIVSLRGRRRLPRETIARVTWASGAGVSLELRDGSIRAWLRRADRDGA